MARTAWCCFTPRGWDRTVREKGRSAGALPAERVGQDLKPKKAEREAHDEGEASFVAIDGEHGSPRGEQGKDESGPGQDFPAAAGAAERRGHADRECGEHRRAEDARFPRAG